MTSRFKNMNCAQDTQDKNQTFISFLSCDFTVKVCFKFELTLGEFKYTYLIYLFG